MVRSPVPRLPPAPPSFSRPPCALQAESGSLASTEIPLDDVPQSTQDLTVFVRACRRGWAGRGKGTHQGGRKGARRGGGGINAHGAGERQVWQHVCVRSFVLSDLCAWLAQVQNLLTQMQGRFATMSDAIIGRSECASLASQPLQSPKRKKGPHTTPTI